MRRSVQKRLDLICTGASSVRTENMERHRQLLNMQTPGMPSASSPVGVSSGLAGNYPWMPEDCPAVDDAEVVVR